MGKKCKARELQRAHLLAFPRTDAVRGIASSVDQPGNRAPIQPPLKTPQVTGLVASIIEAGTKMPRITEYHSWKEPLSSLNI